MAKFPVLYNISFLLIYSTHNSLYFLIPFIYLPRLLSPLVISLFSICVSLLHLVIFIHFIFYIPHISDNMQYLSLTFHKEQYCLGPSTLLQMAKFLLFLWSNSIPLNIYDIFLSTYLLMGT